MTTNAMPEQNSTDHFCHAQGCFIEVPPKMLMCYPHWRKVPKALKDAVWAEYVPGQEISKTPTTAYLTVMIAAINAVADKEGRERLPSVLVTETQNVQQCDLCGKVDELRPYGPNGEAICFGCMLKDQGAAEKRFSESFE